MKKIIIGISAAVALISIIVAIILFIPNGEESYRNIKVYKMQGTSEVIRDDKVLEVYEQMVLKNNDEINVKNNSNLILKLDTDKYVYLEDNTKIKLTSSEKDSSKTVIKLIEGKIITEVKEKLNDNEIFEIETPNSVMAVRGTTFSVEVGKNDNKYEIKYQLIKGEVDVFVFDKSNDETIVSSFSLSPEEALEVIVDAMILIEHEEFAQIKEEIKTGETEIHHYENISDFVSTSNIEVKESEFENEDFDNVNELTETQYRLLTVLASFDVKNTDVNGEHLYESNEIFNVVITADTIEGKEFDYWLVNDEIYQIDGSNILTSTIEITVNSKLIIIAVYKDASNECEHNHSTEYSKDEINHWNECICGDKINVNQHNFSNWQITKESTCEEIGSKWRECNVCGYKETEEIPLSEHDYVQTITKKASCTEEGILTKKCSKCEDIVTTQISKLSHAYGNWNIISESTCNVHGKKERTCLICNYVETVDSDLIYHDFAEPVVTKEPTYTEMGIETYTCIECGYEENYELPMLEGYTVIVSGGTVNRLGENLNQSSIIVPYGEILVITANEYPGYTFYQWFSDGSEEIPTASFELYVTRSCAFYICFEEGLEYGDWVLEKEKTCTENGLYSRSDEVTGLKQYALIQCRGWHDIVRVEQDLENLTCTDVITETYKCLYCDYEEKSEGYEIGHDFTGDYVIVEEAYGAKVGLKEIKCSRCDATKTKEYIKAVYPEGNIKITFDWANRAYTSSADRKEMHWMLDGNKYLFYVNRDSDSQIHFYFYYEDLGPHSPVYVKKIIGDSYSGRNGYGSYGWGIVGYVDSYADFIEYIDDEHKGSDNGRNNSGLHTVYTMWEDIFNNAGGIPSSYYCSAVIEHEGYTVRVYENDGFAYYVTEDNCCLYYSGKGSNRDFAYVSEIEPITEIPYGPIDYSQVSYIMIDIENGRDYNFNDSSYFDVESLYNKVEIYEGNYISNRYEVVGYEVKTNDGTWVKIEELTYKGSYWSAETESDFTYMNIVDKYLGGVYPDCLEIRASLQPKELPVHVTVINGYITSGYNEYGSENKFLANEEISLIPEFDESKYYIYSWKITINGQTEEYVEDYLWSWSLVLPESGEVIAECVLKDLNIGENVLVNVNVIGNGSLNIETKEYSSSEALTAFASAAKGSKFIGWFVDGLFYINEGDMPMPEGNFNEDYYQHGEYFGNCPVYNFNLSDRYAEVKITAIFEEIDPTKDTIEIIVTDGFVFSYNTLKVSALRVSVPTWYEINNEGDIENIIGWRFTELYEEPKITDDEYVWTSFYFEVDTNVTPIIVE